MKVPRLQVIDEVAKVPRSRRRQVPMIQEMQKEKKPEEVQISFKVCVDHAKDGQNDSMSCMKGAPHLVLTSKAGWTKPMCRKTRTSVHVMNSREQQPMKRCQQRSRHEREQSGSTRRVDRSINAHTQGVEECLLTTRHEAWSERRQLQETKGDAEASLRRKTRSRRIHNRGDAHVQERQESSAHVKGSNV